LDTPIGLGGVTEREEKVRRKKRVQGRLTMSNSSKNGDSIAGLQRTISSIWQRLGSGKRERRDRGDRGLNRRSRLVEGVRF
jgi:hypothetical protein